MSLGGKSDSGFARYLSGCLGFTHWLHRHLLQGVLRSSQQPVVFLLAAHLLLPMSLRKSLSLHDSRNRLEEGQVDNAARNGEQK